MNEWMKVSLTQGCRHKFESEWVGGQCIKQKLGYTVKTLKFKEKKWGGAWPSQLLRWGAALGWTAVSLNSLLFILVFSAWYMNIDSESVLWLTFYNWILWSSDYLFLWFSDSRILWFNDPLILWSSDSMILWFSDPVILWSCDILFLWFSVPVILWSCDSLILCSCDSLIQG